MSRGTLHKVLEKIRSPKVQSRKLRNRIVFLPKPLNQTQKRTHRYPYTRNPNCPIRVIIASRSPKSGVRLLFRIFKLQNDGNLHFVQTVNTLNEAKARVQELMEPWPGEYLIHNDETGERLFISASETRN